MGTRLQLLLALLIVSAMAESVRDALQNSKKILRETVGSFEKR